MSLLKSRDITLPTKVHIVKAMVSPVGMCGCVNWTIKKTECPRIDAFELWCWKRLLRVSWTARKSNQSILKEINPEYSLGVCYWNWIFNMLAIRCEKPTYLTRPWCWERLNAKGEGRHQRMRWLDSITDSTVINWSKCWETVKDGEPGVLQSMGALRIRHHLAAEQKIIYYCLSLRESDKSLFSGHYSFYHMLWSLEYSVKGFAFLFFLIGCSVCRILVPWSKMETVTPAVEVQSLNQWMPWKSHGMFFEISTIENNVALSP